MCHVVTIQSSKDISDIVTSAAILFSFNFCCVCRKVFLVAEEMLLSPKIYSPITNYLLHIINNDTGEELDIPFNKAAPHIYRPNKVDTKVTPQL